MRWSCSTGPSSAEAGSRSTSTSYSPECVEGEFCEVKPFAAPSVDACASGEDLSSWEASGYYASVRLFQRNA